jgi:RNA polymerase sigma-70 factor (ECF subfamily)
VDIDTLDEQEGEGILSISTDSPEQLASEVEMRPMLEAAIDALPAILRSVFVLRAVEQLSVQETADTLGISTDTVKTRFLRARGFLKKDLLARMDQSLPGVFPFLGARCDRIVAATLARIASARAH